MISGPWALCFWLVWNREDPHRTRAGVGRVSEGLSRPVCHGGKQLAAYQLLIIDELGFVPLSRTGAELLFEIFSQRYERGATLVTSNLPFNEWTEILGTERLTGALLDRFTHHIHILEMNGESYRLKESKQTRKAAARVPAAVSQ
jgi:hypothetical protein